MSKSKKDFSKNIKKTFDEKIPEDAFGKERSDLGTSRQVIKDTRDLREARYISIEKIQPDPDQPRKAFPEESLKELSESIRVHGILQPVAVEYTGKTGKYKIIVGERRYQAAKLASLKEVPCLILEGVEVNKRKALQLVENLQREDLNPVDKARAIIAFKDLVGTWEKVDELTGLSSRRRQQYTALLKLLDDMQKSIVSMGKGRPKNEFTEFHARALSALKKNPEKQRQLFDLIKESEEPLTGREAIDKAKELKGKPKIKTFTVKYTSKKELIERLEEELKKLKSS